jgi:leader peptidase (prepilin peptidase)/N-methyltransferase
MTSIFDPRVLAQVPFHFWTACFFALGCIVGSFLNVCIHRMPRDESIISPPSHCPHCGYSIPWYLNIPLVTWLWLRGQCAHCKKEISMRYFLVEALTGTVFALCWVAFGHPFPAVAGVYCVLLAGLIAATFIDFEHFIIPDEITLGGMVAGLLLAFFVPQSHLSFSFFQRAWTLPFFQPMRTPGQAMRDSVVGMVVGAGVVYGIVRLGKYLFGNLSVALPPGSIIFFTESALILPETAYPAKPWWLPGIFFTVKPLNLPGGEWPYSDLFYRPGDTIRVEAETIEMIDRCYRKAVMRLQEKKLCIGQDTFDPESVSHVEVVADLIVLPREAMGLGDVKFMAAIGAFLGWPAVLFSLALSSFIGAIVGLVLLACGRGDWSARMPYGPYIAVAAVIWVFGGYRWLKFIF